MEIRRLSTSYAVSPQITPEDVPAIAAAGFTTVLCNRPDHEVPAELSADVMRIAVEAAGLTFVCHPLIHDTIAADTPRQMDILQQADGPVFAYCASGTRCSIVWSLGMAPDLGVDAVMGATRDAGYDLSSLEPHLQALCQSR